MAAGTQKKDQVLYKAVYSEYDKDPLPSRSASGRFHDADSGANTSYLTDSAETAWKEVTFRLRAQPESYRMVEVEVRLNRVMNLADEKVQKRYGVNRQMLIADDYRLTQKVAARLRTEGVEAFWTYSRADRSFQERPSRQRMASRGARRAPSSSMFYTNCWRMPCAPTFFHSFGRPTSG